MKAIASGAIPSPTGKKSFINRNFNTGDIMKLVLDCYRGHNKQLSSFSQQLRGNTVEETCYNVWKFIKDNIRYHVDKGGNQYVQTPAALWSSKVGDCKSFAVFAASCLHNLGIDGVIRFVSYDATDAIPKHVYVVVGNTVVDPCPYGTKVFWNTEFGPQYKYDYSMGELAQIGRIGNRRILRRSAMRGLYNIGGTNCQTNDCAEPWYDTDPVDGGGTPVVDPVAPTKGGDITPPVYEEVTPPASTPAGSPVQPPVKVSNGNEAGPYDVPVKQTTAAPGAPGKTTTTAKMPWWVWLAIAGAAYKMAKG
jgi:hypothetical protein